MPTKSKPSAVLPALLVLVGLWLAPQASPAAEAGAPRIIVVLSDERAMYREVHQGLVATLAAGTPPHELEVITLGDVSPSPAPPENDRPPRLVVTVGTAAARAAAARHPTAPILCTLIPEATFAAIWGGAPELPGAQRLSAIYLDQPVARQMRFTRLLLPGVDTLGMVLGPQSKTMRRELQAAAKTTGLRLYTREWRPDADLAPLIEEVIQESDALLAVPDAGLLTPHRAKWLLYMTYRQRRPLIGYSQSFVDAGALGAVFSTPYQIGREAAEEIVAMLDGPARGAGARGVGPPRYPKYYSIAVNYSVARSLGLHIPTEAQLIEALSAAEEKKP